MTARSLVLGDRTRFGLLPFVARLLVTSEFLVAVRGKIFGWAGQAAYMQAKGMTMITPLLAIALVIEAVGSLCLITGYRARTAAAVMFVYLGIVSVRLHAFWSQSGNAAGANETEFFKNLGMMGCLLMISIYGPGLWALGAKGQREWGRTTQDSAFDAITASRGARPIP
jgi:putative oxidoreductase